MFEPIVTRGRKAPAASVESARRQLNARPAVNRLYLPDPRLVEPMLMNYPIDPNHARTGGMRPLGPDLPEHAQRHFVALPIALLTDRRLIKADIPIAAAIVATIPPGQWQTAAKTPALCAISGFKIRAIYESLARLQDHGWFSVNYLGSKKKRIITPLWLPGEGAETDETERFSRQGGRG